MAEIEEAIKTYLLTRAGLTALVSTRVFLDEVSNGEALPAVVYQQVSDVKSHYLTGQAKLEQPVYQYSAYATTKAAARNIAKQIKAALCDYSGTISGITVQLIRLNGEYHSRDRGDKGALNTIGGYDVYIEDLEFEINYVKE